MGIKKTEKLRHSGHVTVPRPLLFIAADGRTACRDACPACVCFCGNGLPAASPWGVNSILQPNGPELMTRPVAATNVCVWGVCGGDGLNNF